MMKSLFAVFVVFLSYLFIAFPAFAQITKLEGSGCLTGGAKQVATLDCVPIIIGNVIFWLIILAGIVALFLIIYSGLKFVTSGGDPKQAEGARKILTYAVLGLILILSSFIIITFIAQTTGVGCIKGFSFTKCVSEDISFKCSNTHPNGYCTNSEKDCVLNDSRSHWVCKFPCSNTHPNGYCTSGKDCLPNDAGSHWVCKFP